MHVHKGASLLAASICADKPPSHRSPPQKSQCTITCSSLSSSSSLLCCLVLFHPNPIIPALIPLLLCGPLQICEGCRVRVNAEYDILASSVLQTHTRALLTPVVGKYKANVMLAPPQFLPHHPTDTRHDWLHDKQSCKANAGTDTGNSAGAQRGHVEKEKKRKERKKLPLQHLSSFSLLPNTSTGQRHTSRMALHATRMALMCSKRFGLVGAVRAAQYNRRSIGVGLCHQIRWKVEVPKKEPAAPATPATPAAPEVSKTAHVRGNKKKPSTAEMLKKMVWEIWPRGKGSGMLRAQVVLAVSCVFATKLIGIGVPYWFKGIIDSLSSDPSIIAQAFNPYGFTILGLVIAHSLFRTLQSLTQEARGALFAPIVQQTMRSLGTRVAGHLHALPLEFHVNRQTGMWMFCPIG